MNFGRIFLNFEFSNEIFRKIPNFFSPVTSENEIFRRISAKFRRNFKPCSPPPTRILAPHACPPPFIFFIFFVSFCTSSSSGLVILVLMYLAALLIHSTGSLLAVIRYASLWSKYRAHFWARFSSLQFTCTRGFVSLPVLIAEETEYPWRNVLLHLSFRCKTSLFAFPERSRKRFWWCVSSTFFFFFIN